ncbi:MAG: hypothetical protein UFJ18_09810, partial [Blautia sp.]|nr:hypothetical protein [Blautia sp.]
LILTCTIYILTPGWLIGASNVLKNNMDCDLYIMACYSGTNKIINIKIEGINYIIIPNKEYKSNFKIVDDTGVINKMVWRKN